MVEIAVRDLFKSYGDKSNNAINGISFRAPEGKITSILGPSGCGKTTTLRCIAGLEQMDAGEILFGDTVVGRGPQTIVPTARRNIGMAFQTYALWPHMSVNQNIAFGLRARGWKRGDIERRIREVLKLINLPDMGDRYPAQLSGGQQQRVALGRALAYHPKVLLMDEPLANLDAHLREQMRVEIQNLQQRTGVTTLYVTHDRAEAMALSDQMVVLNKGNIMQIGSPRELYDSPANLFVAKFVGHANFIPVRSTDRRGEGTAHVETALGRCIVAVRDETDTTVDCALLVPARGIRLHAGGDADVSDASLSGVGRVIALEKIQHGTLCRFQIDDTAFEVDIVEGGHVPTTDTVLVSVDPAECVLVARGS